MSTPTKLASDFVDHLLKKVSERNNSPSKSFKKLNIHFPETFSFATKDPDGKERVQLTITYFNKDHITIQSDKEVIETTESDLKNVLAEQRFIVLLALNANK